MEYTLKMAALVPMVTWTPDQRHELFWCVIPMEEELLALILGQLCEYLLHRDSEQHVSYENLCMKYIPTFVVDLLVETLLKLLYRRDFLVRSTQFFYQYGCALAETSSLSNTLYCCC